MEVQKIYLARHGETDANLKDIYQGVSGDYPLNEKGKKQAELLAKYLLNIKANISVVIASNTKRSIQTALTIVDKFPEARLIVESKFNEINMGEWEGKTPEEVKNLYPEILEEWWYGNIMKVAFPNGETVLEAINRMSSAFIQMLTIHPKEDFIIIAHGGTNQLILGSILKSLNPKALIQKNTCLNIIERKNGLFLKISLIGSTAHLL